jgi:rubrerythrin
MVDDKDRFGDKLREKEKAEEDRFFAERDKQLLEKLRHCPTCGGHLVTVERDGHAVTECPTCAAPKRQP